MIQRGLVNDERLFNIYYPFKFWSNRAKLIGVDGCSNTVNNKIEQHAVHLEPVFRDHSSEYSTRIHICHHGVG